MSLEKEKLLLSYLLNDASLFVKANSILKASYFDITLKKAVTFTQKYYDEYKGLPTVTQISAETGVILLDISAAPAETKYAEKEIERFCRDKAIEEAVYAAVDLLQEQNLSEIERLIREAVTVSIQRNLGLNYFEDPEARLNAIALKSPKTPTGITKLDDALDGGLYRQGLFIFAAPSGVGKSITMSNVARNFCKQGLNGVYFSLELSQEMVGMRFDSIFTEIGQGAILSDIGAVTSKLKQENGVGSLWIKRLPESVTTANQLRAYLKEYELVTGVVPDFIVVDYLDLMASNNSAISVENQFIKDKYVSEELRAIAGDLDLIMITASQLNRGAQEIETIDELTQGKIAGGISKINSCDATIAIIQSPQMKVRNEMVIKLLKSISSGGVGRYFTVHFDPISLRITDTEELAPSLTKQSHIAAFKTATKVLPTIQQKPLDNDFSSVFQV